MSIAKYIVCLLIAIALRPAGASVNEPDKIVIKGVRNPSQWFRIESQHLIVYSDGDREQVVQLVNNLERLDYVLRLYLRPFLIRQAELPKLTLYFRDRIDWPAGLGEFPVENVGLVDSCISGTQAFTFSRGRMWESTNASLLTDTDDFTQSAIFSLYSQNFLYRRTDIRGPEWFLLGFKLYFGGVRFTGDHMVVGRAAPWTAESMKWLDYGEGHVVFLTYDQVLRKDVPEGFFNHLKIAEKATAAYLAIAEFQSRAFELTHYMLSSAENRDKMEQYLERMNNGSDGAAAFADLFGLSGMTLRTTMWHYRRLLMKVIKVNVPELPAARIDFTRLSRVEGDFVVDNATLKACPSPDNGRKLLQRVQAAAAEARAVDFAQLTLSRAQIGWGNPRDAIPYLTDAAQRAPRNAELHYLLGLANLKLAKDAAGDMREQLVRARSNLTEAARLAPGTPWISYALFHTLLMEPEAPPEEAMLQAIEAWRQGHDVTAFARAAALAHAWLGDSAGAYQVFNTLARNERDPGSAAWAMQWLKRLENGVPRDHLLAAMRDEPLASPGSRLTYGDAR